MLKFTHFHAREAVALVPRDLAGNLYGNLYSWDGPYSFTPTTALSLRKE
jgi:hypothetical protein